MKKLCFSIIAAFMFALSATAMVQGSEPTHGWWQKPIRLDYDMGGPNIKVNETTGLTVTRLYSQNYSAFGYFTYNPVTGAVIQEQAVDFSNGDSVYIGEFEAGTRVGTWLTTDEGKFYSIPGLNEGYEYRAAYLGDTRDGDLVVGLEGGNSWHGTQYDEMVVSFTPGEGQAPTGQPLPGILISSLIGLGVAGISRFKKRGKSS